MMQVKIPENIFVHCPMMGFKLTRALNCADCEHNRSFIEIGEGKEFQQKYRSLCAYPIARRLEAIEL